MRNPSKNTIKKVMKKAEIDFQEHDSFFYHPDYYGNSPNNDSLMKAYFLFNNVGARIYTVSKGVICNRSAESILKYNSKKQ